MIYRLIIFVSLFFSLGCSTSHGEQEESIRPGIYQMDCYLPLLKNKNIAVVANMSSVINGKHLIDTLLNGSLLLKYKFHLKKIFTPEHGFSGNFDAGKLIEKEKSLFDSIPLVSLYGKNKRPASDDLEGLDVIIFDLQDVGVRFYTYISTLHYIMEACAEKNIQLIVLDRPNPHIQYIDGPVLKDGFTSFVGMDPVPIVYGMTIGEYAQMINGEKWLRDSLNCKLSIIKIDNYKRSSFYKFPVKPSPNLPNMRSVLLYPSLCLFEGTIVSVGRGTPMPFQVAGHPDYSKGKYNFIPQSTPGASLNPKLEGEKCKGINFSRASVDSLRKVDSLNISVLLDFYSSLNQEDNFFTNYFDLLAGTDKLRQQIIEGYSEKSIRESWQSDLNKFNEVRQKYLIYPE